MEATGFPTSADIYLELDGRKIAVVQGYTARASKSSQSVEAFGESEPVATIEGQRKYTLELTRLYATEDAVTDGINFYDLRDFSLVICKPDRKVIYSSCQWSAIQESATKSVQQLDIAVQTISQATDLATQSGDALSSIVNMAEETADQVRAIAAASEEQSASSEEITQSIGHVTTISGETAEAMRQSSEAVAELTRQTQELSSLVAEMKRS